MFVLIIPIALRDFPSSSWGNSSCYGGVKYEINYEFFLIISIIASAASAIVVQ